MALREMELVRCDTPAMHLKRLTKREMALPYKREIVNVTMREMALQDNMPYKERDSQRYYERDGFIR